MLGTLNSAVCSLFSYDAISYSIPQLPQTLINSSESIFPASLLFILFISGFSLIALQMRRVAVRNAAASEDINISAIDGHDLNQKGKPPEVSKKYISSRALSIKYKQPNGLNSPSNIAFTKLNDHQKTRRRVYNHFEADDPKHFSLEDIAIEHNFNRIRRNSNGSIKEVPAVQSRSPLVFEQCSAGKSIKLIKT